MAQVYLAVVIARLVKLQASERPRGQDDISDVEIGEGRCRSPIRKGEYMDAPRGETVWVGSSISTRWSWRGKVAILEWNHPVRSESRDAFLFVCLTS